MCGLFGVHSSVLSDPEREVFRELGVVSAFRGRDSTGIFTVGRKNNGEVVRLMKHACNPMTFLYHQDVVNFIKETSPFLMAGHCRSATVGKINRNNAHPFHFGHIYGMHNGTILALAPTKDKEDTESDSSTFFKVLSEEGLDEALKKAKYGAFAFVWIDTHLGTLNFIRNDKRTLYKVTTKGGTMYWASERDFLKFCDSRSAILFNDIEPFEVNKQYVYKIGSITLKNTVDHTKTLETITHYTSGGTSSSEGRFRHYGYESYPEIWDGIGDGCSPFASTSTEARISGASSSPFQPIHGTISTSDIHAALAEAKAAVEAHTRQKRSKNEELFKYRAFQGRLWNLDFAQERLNEGCACCGTVLGINDDAAWVDSEGYLCNKCVISDYVFTNFGASLQIYPCELVPTNNKDD